MLFRVGVNAKFFMDWGGGVDFLRLIVRGLQQVPTGSKVEIFFLIPLPDNSFLKRAKLLLKKTIYKILNKAILTPNLNSDNLIKSFENEGEIKWIYYPDLPIHLEKICIENSIDLILPSFQSLGKNFPLPWVGYIFDFQHKYLPDWFTKKDVFFRDKQFEKTLQDAKNVLVNAIEVKNDVKKFAPNSIARVTALPFTPLFDLSEYAFEEVRLKFGLDQDYFLVSNQFWKHKNHETLFKAFAIFLKSNPTFKLVCTGEMKDYRNPAYIDSLKALVDDLGIQQQLILTGYISKREQKELMFHARSVVQPTIFEGGPGGGSVYEALGMGIPVVLSDIAINKEIDSPIILFFEALNEQDLANKLTQILQMPRMNQSNLENYKVVAESKLGNTLLEAMVQCKKNYGV